MAGLKDVARQAGIDDELAKRLVDAIGLMLQRGETVRIRGLGSFAPVQRAARKYKTPVMSGPPTFKPAHRSVMFRPSDLLIDALNPDQPKTACEP